MTKAYLQYNWTLVSARTQHASSILLQSTVFFCRTQHTDLSSLWVG